jgi:hypothetical protein
VSHTAGVKYHLLVALVALIAACGDDPHTCPAGASGDLPTEGPYIDPYAIELSETCVTGGLYGLPGRWFVADAGQSFLFEYPRYEGDCDTGVRRMGLGPDEHEGSDNSESTLYTWSDGTRYFQRTRSVFGDQETVRVTVGCMLPDDTLAVTYVRFDTNRGERIFHATGKRFAPKDALARGLELVGELGPATGTPIFGLNLVVDGNYAYVVGLTGLDVVDVSNPSAPALVGHIDGRLNDVRIVHGMTSTVAFASSEGGDDRTWIIDVTTPTAPNLVSVIDEYSHSLQTRTVGDATELYLANYSEAIPRFDVTNPLTPVRTGTIILPGETVSGVHDLTVYGSRIYANNTDAGFVAVDVSGGIDNPVELGRTKVGYSHASWAGTIGGREIVLHGDEGMTGTSALGAYMRVLDGDPASSTFFGELAQYRTRPEVGIHNIEVHGTRAYIAYYQDGVRIVDLADPTHPVEVAHYNTWDDKTAYGGAFEGTVGVRKVGDLIYVADDLRGLIILREL